MPDNGDALMQAAGFGEPTIEEPQPTVPTQPEPVMAQPQQPQIPQFDPSLFVGALENIHTRLDGMNQYQQPQMPQQPPTQEELIIQQLAEKMGLTTVMQEKEQLKQALEEQKKQIEQANQYIQQQQVQQVQQSIIGKYEGITKDMVIGKLQGLAGQYGEQFATLLNNPQGWDYVISQHLQKPLSTPDPIVSSEAGTSDFTSSASERIRNGNVQQGDVGELLASYLK